MRLWLYRKLIFQKKIFSEPTTLFSLMGISFGVAFLVVSMAGFSGFTRSLKSSIIDVSGDINIFKQGKRIDNPEKVIEKIKKASPRIKESLGFVSVEVLVANKGNLSAVLLRGMDWNKLGNLKELSKRVVDKIEDPSRGFGHPAFIGKVVAQKLKLKVGDHFKIILPEVSRSSSTRVSSKVEGFYVHSVLDFGKYEFNERIMIAEIKQVQKLAGMGEKINGFRIKIRDSDKAPLEAGKIQEALGWDYLVRDWSMINRSLFKAIRYEKTVLFFIMLIMVVAAFFNVSTTLFLGVLRRYSQIGVLRALGLGRGDILFLFCLQGLILGVTGLSLGLGLGLLFCHGFDNLQKIYPIMPEDVYRLSNFATHLQWTDTVWVTVATLVICLLSSLAPAIRGARLSPVEGLKYE